LELRKQPMAANNTLSLRAMSDGKSSALKKGPFEVPPRINKQGTAVCEEAFIVWIKWP
jgi:hypothetical protein